jgi:type I restriction enzyme S subunit
VKTVHLHSLFADRVPSIDPAQFASEHFELWSIPSYDLGKPEELVGSAIGSSKKLVQPNDVLLSRIVPHIRRAWVVSASNGTRQLASSEWIVFRNPHVDPKYLRHFFLSDPFHIQFMQTVAGVGGSLLRARPEGVGAISVPLPPLDEQRRIAAILDQADDLRRKRREALACIDTLSSSIFVEMFGEIESNTFGWSKEVLSEVVREDTIVTYGIVQAGEEFDGGVPYIRTGDIVDGEIKLDQLRRTDPAIAARFSRSRVEADEIVMSIRATVGTTAFVPPELHGANLTQGTARISPGRRTDRHYLLAYLRSNHAQHWLQRQVKGATFREITLNRLREMPILVPRLGLQRAFAARIIEIDKLKAHHRAYLAKLDALFASLQHRAFRSEL